MASSSSSSNAPPSTTQLLFARSVIYTFDLWPALRLAISEQWGGIDSKAKADFLISYICDQYSSESSTQAADTTTITTTTIAAATPVTPDVDDLADILEAYFADEYESRLEDGSPDLIASRLIQFHKIIYSTFPPTQESLAKANDEVKKLEQAAISRRGQKVVAQQQQQNEDESFSNGDESGSEQDSDDAMEVDAAEAAPFQSTKSEPIVDEDGFTTVVKSKRR